jgi:hypothetical protein
MLGHLVVGLPRSVITGFSDELIPRLLLHEKEARMAAGDDQRKSGVRNGLVSFDVSRPYVSLDVVHGEKGQTPGVSDGLAETKTDEKRAHQTRSLCDGHRVDSIEADLGFSQRPFDDGSDVSQVLTGSDLGDHPPIGTMNGNLRCHEVG